LKRAQSIAPITSLQPRYSLLHREIEGEILPFVARENIGVIAYSPMASGLLTGAMTRERIEQLPADDWRGNHPDFLEPLRSRNLRLVRLLKAIGAHYGCTPAEVAVAWVPGWSTKPIWSPGTSYSFRPTCRTRRLIRLPIRRPSGSSCGAARRPLLSI
jgi:aryl-alcohol dehydrogenase-like predicted oxidoreductase